MPLLFNLIIDVIIDAIISENTQGIKIQELNVAILAFADDMVLLAKDEEEAKVQIRKLDSFLQQLGTGLAIDKCCTFEIVSAHKT